MRSTCSRLSWTSCGPCIASCTRSSASSSRGSRRTRSPRARRSHRARTPSPCATRAPLRRLAHSTSPRHLPVPPFLATCLTCPHASLPPSRLLLAAPAALLDAATFARELAAPARARRPRRGRTCRTGPGTGPDPGPGPDPGTGPGTDLRRGRFAAACCLHRTLD